MLTSERKPYLSVTVTMVICDAVEADSDIIAVCCGVMGRRGVYGL